MKSHLISNPNPTSTYDGAMVRFEQLKNRPTSEPLHPNSHDILLTYNRKVARSIVLLHGYTNSPHQFRQLGGLFYAAGYNVLIPRMPHHGLKNPLNTDQAQLKAQEMVSHADAALDIATGLGDHVTVMGISAGGNLTGWLLHQRPEVDCAVLIAPAFGMKVVKQSLTTPALQMALRLPNQFFAWNNDGSERAPNQMHAYPQFSTRALANVITVGQSVVRMSKLRQPFPKDIVVVTNENDAGVNNELIYDVVKNWRNLGTSVRTHHFEKALMLDHDNIDPNHPHQNIALVYPMLVNFVLNSPTLEAELAMA